MGVERELKCQISSAELSAFKRDALLQKVRPRLIHLHSVYFDTPDQSLRRSGFVLRVRKENDRFIQTVKATHAQMLRAEWNCTLTKNKPSFASLKDTPLRDILSKAKIRRDLQVIFATHVERHVWQIEWQGAQIEVALDEGAILANAYQLPVCEIEFELKSQGGLAPLFSLAQEFSKRYALRLSTISKDDRGQRLADGLIHQPFKVGAPIMSRNQLALDAFQTIVFNCLQHFEWNAHVLIATGDVEATHQARIAIRRLRSALWFFKPLLATSFAAPMRDELCWLSAQLGAARDLDVFWQLHVQPLLERGTVGGAQALNLIVQNKRAKAYEDLRAALNSARLRTLLFELAEPRAHAAPLDRFLKRRVSARLRQLIKQGKNLRHLTAPQRHRLRINAKKLRYCAEFFGSLLETKKVRARQIALINALSVLQDTLGREQDSQNAHHQLAQMAQLDSDNCALVFAAGMAAGVALNFDLDACLGQANLAYQCMRRIKPLWA